jgi:hypothetical protein
MVTSLTRQVIHPITKLVNTPLSQRGRERRLDPQHLTMYYKILNREARGKVKRKGKSFIPSPTLLSPILSFDVRRKC